MILHYFKVDLQKSHAVWTRAPLLPLSNQQQIVYVAFRTQVAPSLVSTRPFYRLHEQTRVSVIGLQTALTFYAFEVSDSLGLHHEGIIDGPACPPSG